MIHRETVILRLGDPGTSNKLADSADQPAESLRAWGGFCIGFSGNGEPSIRSRDFGVAMSCDE